ncbi:MAG TPA: sigma-70 family RNA polymerase sigma factor [Solirubrobacteraceae bacterium]|nr:sigma-70 family RNA polymerase sigma factor [Solirubrobacteraceae bacterium]
MTPTDAELLRTARRDADAFAELYDRYAQRAVGWARRGGVAEADVVDLAAELFAEAWRSRRRFRDPGDGSAAAWLHGIARHLIARYHRRARVDDSARRRLGMSLDYAVEQVVQLDGDGGELELAVAGLPPAQATAVRLRIVDELPYDEIASRLSCTPVTARKHVSLGLRALRNTLDPEMP